MKLCRIRAEVASEVARRGPSRAVTHDLVVSDEVALPAGTSHHDRLPHRHGLLDGRDAVLYVGLEEGNDDKGATGIEVSQSRVITPRNRDVLGQAGAPRVIL